MLNGEQNNDVEDAYNESNLKTDTTGKSTTEGPSIATGTPNETIDPNDKQPNRERLATRTTTISFDVSTEAHTGNTALYIPGPRARERGKCGVMIAHLSKHS